MNPDCRSHAATRARTPRSAVLLGVVLMSLVGCSSGEPSGTDSVVAVEQAQAEAAAELAEVQAALDKQVQAADEQLAEARAAQQEQAAQHAVPVTAKAAVPDRTAAKKTAGGAPVAVRSTSTRSVPRRAAATAVAKVVARPVQGTPGKGPQASKGTGAGGPAAAPAPAVAARAPRGAAVPEPSGPASLPTPTGQPQDEISSAHDLLITIAPGRTVTAAGDPAAAQDCWPQELRTGDRVLLTTDAGLLVREAVLPACHREGLPAAGTDAAPTSPRLSVTLPAVPWHEGDDWVLQIGSFSWLLTASTLSQYGWSITVTADGGVTAGPALACCQEQPVGAVAAACAGDGTATTPAPAQGGVSPSPCSG